MTHKSIPHDRHNLSKNGVFYYMAKGYAYLPHSSSTFAKSYNDKKAQIKRAEN